MPGLKQMPGVGVGYRDYMYIKFVVERLVCCSLSDKSVKEILDDVRPAIVCWSVRYMKMSLPLFRKCSQRCKRGSLLSWSDKDQHHTLEK